MKDNMIRIVEDMIAHGYCLVDETPTQFVDRMISYGFTDATMNEWRERFLTKRGF